MQQLGKQKDLRTFLYGTSGDTTATETVERTPSTVLENMAKIAAGKPLHGFPVKYRN